MKSSYLWKGHHYFFPGCDGSEGGRKGGRDREGEEGERENKSELTYMPFEQQPCSI